MGADYYIAKVLYVYLNDGTILRTEIEKYGQYYLFHYDEDEIDYNYKTYQVKLDEYIENCYQSIMEDIIIYNNNSFTTVSCEKKYKQFVEDKLNERNKIWSEISKIIKVEERYPRE
jgi:hypothetical protein